MKKETIRLFAGICAIISLVLGSLYLFVLSPPADEPVSFAAIFFLIIALALNRFAGRRIVDEREIRISAKANKWGMLSLLAFTVIISTLAKDSPGFIDVRLVAGGALYSALIASMLAFQILKMMPNAEIDKWGTK